MRKELVTTLKRQATKMRAEPEKHGEPLLITQQHMKLLEGIARGEKAVEEGRTLSHAAAKQRIGRWLK